jgi:uncharacterized protein YjbI with pentapeptide repeats
LAEVEKDHRTSGAHAGRQRVSLLADCQSCFGLCCVALPFAKSADFAFDKEGGEPCRNLDHDLGCGIHDELRTKGFAGCTVYDCFGAGQQLSQVTFGGRDWRKYPETARQMFALLPIMRQLHEFLWYLDAALAIAPSAALRRELKTAMKATTELVSRTPDVLLEFDIGAHRGLIGPLLIRTSKLVRAAAVPGAEHHTSYARADLIGAKFLQADLRAADFRGAYLIGADLRGADLRLADLIGADLRGADVRGANLATSLFLTQFQVNAARGDLVTVLPASLTRPSHWTPR